jgi:MFS family permease
VRARAVADDRPTRVGVSTARVAGVCAAEILSLAGYSLVPALLPEFMETWSLTSAEGGWLAGIMFAGYMVAVVPLVSLTDIVPARIVCLVSSALSTLACFGLALSDSLSSGLGFRALAGIALAGMYMPGLRALTAGIEGPRRARVAALYTSSFTIGASLSFLIGQLASLWSWRSAFAAAGVMGAVGVLIGWATLPRSPVIETPFRPSLLSFHAVFRNRDAVALAVGYAAVIWGSSGLRQWIVLFLAFCAGDISYGATQDWTRLMTAALIGLLGVPAGLLGNELALRIGLRTTAILVFIVSVFATGLFGFAAMLPLTAALLLSLVAGFVVQGNFSNLTSGLLATASPQSNAGATMALYSAIGFGGGFIGTWLFGMVLDWSGGPASPQAWVVAFATCGFGCLIGAFVMASLFSEEPGLPARK